MKNYRRFIIQLFIVVSLAFAVEFVIDAYEKGHYYEYNINMDDISPQIVDSKLEYSFSVPRARYKEFRMSYESDGLFDYEIGSYDDVAYEDRSVAITDISFVGGDIDLSYEDEDAHPNIVSVSFRTANGSINMGRFMWMVMLFYSITFFLDRGFTVGNKQIIYAVTFGIITGLMLISVTGFRLKGWDEHIHFNEAWQGSFLGQIKDNDLINELRTESEYTEQWTHDTLSEREEALNGRDLEQGYSISDKVDRPSLSRLSYLPYSVGLFLGRLFHLPIKSLFYMGKVFALLFYMVLLGVAASMCPHLKNIILIIGLLPTSVFMTTIYTYDSFLTYLTLFGMALMIEEYLGTDTVRMSRFFLSVVLILVGCIPKEIYIFLVLPWLLFGRSKFESVKQYRISIITTIGAVLLGIASFIVPTMIGLSGGTDYYSDTRAEDANMAEQIKFVFANPIRYAKLLLFCIYTKMDDFFFGSIYGLLGYLGRFVGFCTRGFFILIMSEGVMLSNQWADKDKRPVVQLRMKAALVIVISAIIVLIWSVLYACFTAVGADSIEGVQARYYLPLLFPISLLLFNDKIQLKCDINKYNKLIMGVMMTLCVVCMFNVFRAQ